MIRIDTVSGLHGTLIEYRQTGENEGKAIVLRDEVPLKSRPYSIHTLYAPDPVNSVDLAAENGYYDLTLEEARSAFRLAVK